MELKIPFYNLVNMLLIGFIFIIGYLCLDTNLLNSILRNIYWYNISSSLIIMVVIPIAYQIGLIINRLGSLLENVLKSEKTVQERSYFSIIFQFSWRKYELYQKTEKLDPFVKVLSREYALSRNSLMLFLVLSIFAYLYDKNELALVFVGLSILFYLSTRKHAGKIVSRIDYNTKTNRK